MSDSHEPLNLKELSRELAAAIPPFTSSAIEDRLRKACRERRRRRFQWRAGLAAVAACLLFAIGFGMHLSHRNVDAETPAYAGFLALPYAQSDVPLERTIVVPVELQPGDLEALGLPSHLIRNRTSRRADLLVGQDGVARAVRIAQ